MADKPLTIILEWTADCVKYVGDKLFLNTGSNEVEVSSWERLRWTVADIVVAEGTKLSEAQRKEGRIIEIMADIAVDPKNPQKAEVKAAATLKDMEVQEAIAVVSECSNLDTLKAWKKRESRDSVLLAINEQVAKVEA
jgi:hypothetical protein